MKDTYQKCLLINLNSKSLCEILYIFCSQMKRHFSCGDMPKPSQTLNEIYLSKEEERLMIKGI